MLDMVAQPTMRTERRPVALLAYITLTATLSQSASALRSTLWAADPFASCTLKSQATRPTAKPKPGSTALMGGVCPVVSLK
jgi:hypothetical protein